MHHSGMDTGPLKGSNKSGISFICHGTDQCSYQTLLQHTYKPIHWMWWNFGYKIKNCTTFLKALHNTSMEAFEKYPFPGRNLFPLSTPVHALQLSSGRKEAWAHWVCCVLKQKYGYPIHSKTKWQYLLWIQQLLQHPWKLHREYPSEKQRRRRFYLLQCMISHFLFSTRA